MSTSAKPEDARLGGEGSLHGSSRSGRIVRVVSRVEAARDVVKFTLADTDGGGLAPFTPGAHIDIHLPSGLIRQYSLCGDHRNLWVYDIAVKREPNGRGGSVQMHDLKVGTVLSIGAPRNNFPLIHGPHRSIFIAGGIGITPIFSMINALAAVDAAWELHYCARSAAHAAFFEDLRNLASGRVHAHFSEHSSLNVATLLGTIPREAHIYCCGPARLMAAVSSASSERPASQVHFESFQPTPVSDGTNTSFEVELRRSGRTLTIPPNFSILQVVRTSGIDAASSCEQGVCGTCEVRVLEGEPDHRDSFLTAEEKAANRSMMICVSRSLGRRLVLDL